MEKNALHRAFVVQWRIAQNYFRGRTKYKVWQKWGVAVRHNSRSNVEVLSLAQDSVQLGTALGANTLGHTSTVLLDDNSGEGHIPFAALHAVGSSGITFLGHCFLHCSVQGPRLELSSRYACGSPDLATLGRFSRVSQAIVDILGHDKALRSRFPSFAFPLRMTERYPEGFV